MYIDSHCHLFHSMDGEDISPYLHQHTANFSYLIDISTNVKEFLNSLAYSLPEKVLRAVGLYPELAREFDSTMKQNFESTIHKHPPQAIGEVGLDFHWDYGDISVQEPLFRHQIECAIDHSLPLIIHSRDAFEDSYRILASYDFKVPVILHCYGYGPHEAEKFGFEGPYYFSFAGNLTYKNATDLQEAARIIPLDRLLLETDSPYLSPVPKRGKPNFPHFISHTYDYISALKEIELKELITTIEENFKTVFKIRG